MQIVEIQAVYTLPESPGTLRVEALVDFGDGPTEVAHIHRASDPYKSAGIDAALTVWEGPITEWVPPDPSVDDLKSHAAAVRFARETGGLTIGGQNIATDRESQTLITGAYNLALQDPNLAINWKTATGFVQIDAPTMIAIATSVAQHVQSCFIKEAEVVADIEGGTITTYAQIDTAFATL